MSASGTGFSPNIALGNAGSFGSVLKPLRQRALREVVFETVLNAIIGGEMKEGDWLNHQKLAEQFEVSATPVREALQELASFGIVENQHNRGTVVRPFGPKQIEELYAVRSLLEVEATRLASTRMDFDALKEIGARTKKLLDHQTSNWVSEVPKVDKQLHDFIATACGNQRLQEEIHRYHFFIFIPQTLHRPAHKLVLDDHISIIEDLLCHRAKSAGEAMKKHLANASRMCCELLFPAKAAEVPKTRSLRSAAN